MVFFLYSKRGNFNQHSSIFTVLEFANRNVQLIKLNIQILLTEFKVLFKLDEIQKVMY